MVRFSLAFIFVFPLWVQAQWSASFRIANQVQLSPNIYEYDVFLQNTSAQSFRLHSYQFGVGIDTAVLAGGSVQVEYINGSCQLSNSSQAPIWQYDSATATVFTNINVGASVYTISGRQYRFINCTAVLPPLFIQASQLPVSTAGCPQPGVRIGRFRVVNSVPFGRATRPFHVFSEVNAAGVTRSVVSLFLSPTTQQFLYPNATANVLGLFNWNTAGSCDSNPLFNCSDSNAVTASICAPDSFWLGGVAYSVSGTYQANLSNSYGCDSLVTLVLSVSSPPVVGGVQGNDSLCIGSTSVYASTVGGGVWSSSNPAVLGVLAASGQATALSAGVADVVYTVAGTGGCPSAQALKRVVVTARPTPPLIFVSINSDTIYSNSSDGNRWFRDGVPLAAFNDSGYISNPANGNYRCIRRDNLGCESDSSNLLIFLSSGFPGWQNLSGTPISVTPNPNKGIFSITHQAFDSPECDVFLTNSLGKRCAVLLERNSEISNNCRIQIVDPIEGVYFLTIVLSDKVVAYFHILIQN